MVIHRTRERALAMAKKFRFDQTLRKFGQVDGDKGIGKAVAEPFADWIEGNVARPPDGPRRRSLAGACFSEQQGGKIFHAIPQVAVIGAGVVGKDIIPQRKPQLPHGGTDSYQRANDEIVGAPELIEEPEVTQGIPIRKASGSQNGNRLVGK